MANLNNIIAEFDPVRRILHFTADKVLYFTNRRQLQQLYDDACSLFEKYGGGEKCYMIADLSRFVIEPSQAEFYAQKMGEIKSRYLYPGGLAGYGFEITRITIQMSYNNIPDDQPRLFKTRVEAENYIESLRTARAKASGEPVATSE